VAALRDPPCQRMDAAGNYFIFSIASTRILCLCLRMHIGYTRVFVAPSGVSIYRRILHVYEPTRKSSG